MPYATVSAYLRKFGRAEAVQVLVDEERLLTEQLLLDAIAVADGGAWSGSPSEAEQAAAIAALERLQRQLLVTSNLMDGYLRAAVKLPLAPDVAAVLEDCCMALVRCELHDDEDNATERMDEAGKNWRTWLRDVQAGKVLLAGPGGEAVPSTLRIQTGQASSAFNWGAFGRIQ